ncbi:cysteine methyltransferase [Dokdonia sp. Dokd-P16]|uniref:methylated-DNA--[protein]-cysteine S-methyltransferase n=1 Tax=Dokdonia sp. Dokd-P16 TaxID=2173169 RepID=UPI000D54570E|nr:methylated-DNA--[protein]-cysteine S-methyltransferase [Dokdonia sp. Dokd-P16]AWH73850.1 cysteine methyltransferase [Dokdonia sp. Dokd-P16]
MEHAIIATPIGLLELKASSDGLSSVLFIETDALPTTIIPKALDDAVAQILEYFARERTTFSLKLNPSGTDFQRRVWRELEAIPFGKTTSYLAMAKQLGDPKVIRAAASANGKNPLSIIIPCHRVIGSDGSLTGYAGGLYRKKWLLEHESPVTQGSLF